MTQTKLFCDIESGIESLESKVNDWLTSNPNIKNVRITGNIAPQTVTTSSTQTGTPVGQRFASSDIFVIIQYETE